MVDVGEISQRLASGWYRHQEEAAQREQDPGHAPEVDLRPPENHQHQRHQHGGDAGEKRGLRRCGEPKPRGLEGISEAQK